MRILYSHRIQSRDGQSVHLEEMVAAFRALGHEVVVVGPRLYRRSEFGGESRLLALVRARLPPWRWTLASWHTIFRRSGACNGQLGAFIRT